jgi:Asp-tRNA(Asn)/Glu-tRNA(Gln) amidotransferase A subunit family amidase
VKQTEYVRTAMWTTLGPILEEYDILVCPTLAVPSIAADHRNDDPDFRINGKRIDAYVQWAMTYPFNLVSQCPVASVPTGFADSGVPTGMQIVGKSFDDLGVMRAAAAFEAIRPWGGPAPGHLKTPSTTPPRAGTPPQAGSQSCPSRSAGANNGSVRGSSMRRSPSLAAFAAS